MKQFNLATPFIILYFLLTTGLIWIGSIIEVDSFIDHQEIKDLCDAIEQIQFDDIREIMAYASLVAILPLGVYSLINRCKICWINFVILLLLLQWGYCYIVKFENCLWY